MPTRRNVAAAGLLAPVLGSALWLWRRVRAPHGVEVESNVRYGVAGGEPLLLDAYRPLGRQNRRPAMVLIHGGGFVGGSRTDASVAEPARRFAEAGYVAFSVGYRLFDQAARRNAWPTPLDDVQRAVRWVRANADEYGVDPERLGAYGVSAGGGLAAHLGVRDTREGDPALAGFSSRVRCVVDLAGPTDATIPSTNPSDLAFGQAFLGGTLAETPDAYRDASLPPQVDRESAPFLVVHGARDTVVPVEHARRLVASLREAQVAVEYVELPNADHGVFGWDLVGPLALPFLNRYLAPNR